MTRIERVDELHTLFILMAFKFRPRSHENNIKNDNMGCSLLPEK